MLERERERLKKAVIERSKREKEKIDKINSRYLIVCTHALLQSNRTLHLS